MKHGKQLSALEQAFINEGGLRERMTRARITEKGCNYLPGTWGHPWRLKAFEMYPCLRVLRKAGRTDAL